MTSPLPLADAFPVFTEDDWRAAVSKAKRVAVRIPNDSVVSGVDAGPVFARRVAAQVIGGRPGIQPCRVVQRVDFADLALAARAIGEDAAGGATGAEIAFAGSIHPLGGRLSEDAAPAIAKALAGTLPNNFQLRIDHRASATVADAFLDLAAARRAELVFAYDPIATVAVCGSAAMDAVTARINITARAFDTRGIDGAVVVADGRLWHAGGATEEQELAATLATFVGYLRLLDAPGRIGAALAADSDQFRTIAKFRAMRLLLARVAEVTGFSSSPPRIHAETAWRTMSARDPEMNILRATSATFAAAAGGADSISVLPFDLLAGGNDGHARRLARNTLTILAQEAHLFRVADPGAGSGAIEVLTETLAKAAWKRFQDIEKEGGILAAIANGSLLREIAETRDARLAGVVRRDIKMVGVNAYADDNGGAPAKIAGNQSATLIFTRLSEAFEAAK